MSKTIPLSQEKVALIDDEDYDRVNQYLWCASLAPDKKTYYAKHELPDGDRLYLHRFIASATKDILVDHKNHNGLDCRKENLRQCTRAQNNANKSKTHGGSKYKGVCWDKSRNKWKAELTYDYTHVFIGRFSDEIEAALAYDTEARRYFDEFAHTNFPQKGDSNYETV
jgi:hypothetical protein